MFSFVIPNFNGEDYLPACLNSILKQKGKIKKEVIVVDNGSSDQSLSLLKKKIKEFEKVGVSFLIIKNDKNLGFAGAVNQGIRKSKYSYLVVMNNDLKLKEDWLEEMVGVIRGRKKEKGIGAYFGQVLNWEGKKIESTGLVYFPWGKAINRDNGRLFKKSKQFCEEIIWGGSASVIVYSKKALQATGLFDPLFFAYLEDVDLALRLNDSGFKTLFIPKAIAYHRGGGTADKQKGLRYRLVARNWWFIILKHYSLSYLFKYCQEVIIEQFKNFYKVDSLVDKLWVVREVISKWPKINKKRKPILVLPQAS